MLSCRRIRPTSMLWLFPKRRGIQPPPPSFVCSELNHRNPRLQTLTRRERIQQHHFHGLVNGGQCRRLTPSTSPSTRTTDRLFSTITTTPTTTTPTRNRTLEELETETTKIIHSLSSSSSTIPGLTLMHIDRLMEEWSYRITTITNRHPLSSSSSPSSSSSGRAPSPIYCATRTEHLLLALESNLFDPSSPPSSASSSFSSSPSLQIVPNAVSYNHVCNAYARAASASSSSYSSTESLQAAQAAEAVLDRMIHRCHTFRRTLSQPSVPRRRPPPEPTIITFNSVMDAWAKTNCREGGMNAERVFQKAERWGYDCRTVTAFTAANGRGEAGVRRGGVRGREVGGGGGWYKGVRPNARSLAIVLDAWGNAINGRSNHHEEEKDYGITRIHSPHRNNHHHHHHHHHGNGETALGMEGLDRVVMILHHAIDVTRRSIEFSNRRFATATTTEPSTLDSEQREEDDDDDDDNNDGYDETEEITPSQPISDANNIQLNIVAFHSVLHAFARTIGSINDDDDEEERIRMAQRAEEVFHRLQQLYDWGDLEGSGDDDRSFVSSGDDGCSLLSESKFKPNARTYALLVKCWADAVRPSNSSANEFHESVCK